MLCEASARWVRLIRRPSKSTSSQWRPRSSLARRPQKTATSTRARQILLTRTVAAVMIDCNSALVGMTGRGSSRSGRSSSRPTVGATFERPRRRAAAYRVLSLCARRVIDRVEIEHANHGGNENGKLPVTFDHFVEYGIHRHSVAPGMREAVALGFLEITQKGRAGNAEHRSPNFFRLTYRPQMEYRLTDLTSGGAANLSKRPKQSLVPRARTRLRKKQKPGAGKCQRSVTKTKIPSDKNRPVRHRLPGTRRTATWLSPSISSEDVADAAATVLSDFASAVKVRR
jgi:hypothetical protein